MGDRGRPEWGPGIESKSGRSRNFEKPVNVSNRVKDETSQPVSTRVPPPKIPPNRKNDTSVKGEMIKTSVTVDGLWRCLCPAVDGLTLARALASPLEGRPTWRRRPGSVQCLAYSSAPRSASQHSKRPRRALSPQLHVGRQGARHIRFSSTTCTAEPQQERREPAGTSGGYITVKPGVLRSKGFDKMPKKTWEALQDPALREPDGSIRVECADIMDYLRELRDTKPHAALAAGFWAQLVQPCVRGREPLVDDAILRAQCHREGSAEVVRKMLDDMAQTGYSPPSTSLHHALRVLATHPDYMLRNQILELARAQYMELTPEGHESVVLGLLRDGQYEIAIDKLEQLVHNGVEMSPWIFDVFIYVFAELGFLDEVFKLISHRLGRDRDSKWPHAITWYFLLDRCSRRNHHDGTKYVWNLAVPDLVNPADGMLENVLATAAKGMDADLASQAIRMLASRGNKLGLQHYEPLIECYASGDEVEKALNVLCIMHRAGVKSDAGSTRAIYQVLKSKQPHELTETVRMLFRLKAQGPVPVSAFNVVLEATIDRRGLGPAMDLYRRVRQIVAAGPNTDTFNTILRKLWQQEQQQTGEALEFLLGDMAAMGVKPNRYTYEYVVHNLARANRLRDALDRLDEMSRTFDRSFGRNGWVTKETVLFMLRRLRRAGDEDAARALLAESNARGLKVSRGDETSGRSVVARE